MTSESLRCYERVRKRQKKNHRGPSLSNWSCSSGIHLTSELLAEVGVGILEDDSSCSNSSFNVPASTVSADTKKGEKNWPSFARMEPTPPGNSTLCTVPPKNKHSRNEPNKKQHSDAQTPFRVNRRTRVDSPAGHDAFVGLSDEIVLHIFKWLPKTTLINCARTCKRWRRLSYDHSLWTRLNLGDKSLGPDVLRQVLGRGVVVLRLAKSDIHERQNISPLPLSSPANKTHRFCKLQHLDLSMAVISEVVLENILGVCDKLRNLSLENCRLNDNICRCVSVNSGLDQLNLAMCTGLTATGIKSILTRCVKLSALNLAWTGLSKFAVSVVVKYMPTYLMQLNLSGCRYTLTDGHVEDLISSCIDLEELDLSDAVNLTQLSVAKIAEHGMDLRCLSLTRCYTIAKDSYKLLDNCPRLEHLQIFGLCTKAELNKIQADLETININKEPFSEIARPTTGVSVTSIWGLRVRD